MFFFPSGFKVERHVLQGGSLSGAVRQDTLGKLPDVPVPKKINSNVRTVSRSTVSGCEVTSWSNMRRTDDFRDGLYEKKGYQ
jgi:hypothetical protein